MKRQLWALDTVCRNTDKVLPYRPDVFLKSWQKLAKIKMNSSRLSYPHPRNLRWAKWVVKCPCTELNIGYKIYMVYKEVFYMITPLIRTVEREWDSTLERKTEEAMSKSKMSKNWWKESLVPVPHLVHPGISLRFHGFSQMLTCLCCIALRLTAKEYNHFTWPRFVLILLSMSDGAL